MKIHPKEHQGAMASYEDSYWICDDYTRLDTLEFVYRPKADPDWDEDETPAFIEISTHTSQGHHSLAFSRVSEVRDMARVLMLLADRMEKDV